MNPITNTEAGAVADVAAKKVMMPIGANIYGGNERFPMGKAYENAARRNHNQSLAKLASRGGLTWCEGAALVEMRPWWQMDQTTAEAAVRQHLEQGATAGVVGGKERGDG